MIMLQLPDAQRELPALAAKALDGEEVVIVVDGQRLRLMPTGEAQPPAGPTRPGRGAWKGRLVIPDAFHQNWDADEIGEGKA